MFSGAYSDHYKVLEQQHLENLKETNTEHRGDVIAKSKMLSHETNRRRRALAIKRKVEAQREEKRRQEILSKRRDRQREVTEKFQRSHSKKSSRGGHSRSPKSSPSPTRGVTSTLIPGLEDALRAVRGSPPSSRQGSAGSVSHHLDTLDQSKHSPPKEHQSAMLSRQYYNKYSSHRPLSPTERAEEQAKEIAVRAELHNRSLRNLTNSRSLFEQQLEQHQQLLLEQQKTSLRDFDTAVKKEIEDDLKLQRVEETGGELGRSESLSSLDSLEAQCSPGKENSSTSIETNFGGDGGEPTPQSIEKTILENEPKNSGSGSSIAIPVNYNEQSGLGTVLHAQGQTKVQTQQHQQQQRVQARPRSAANNQVQVAHADSSRSDMTTDTVSTIDIRDGTTCMTDQQREQANQKKQFFLPRYDTFTDLSNPSCQPGEAVESDQVNDWVSSQNEMLLSRKGIYSGHEMNGYDRNYHAKGTTAGSHVQSDSGAYDGGTFYMKTWASPSAMPSVSAAQAQTSATLTPKSHQSTQPLSIAGTSQKSVSVARPPSAKTRVRSAPTAVTRTTKTEVSVLSNHVISAHVNHYSDHPDSQISVQTKLDGSSQKTLAPGIANGGLGFSNGTLIIVPDANQADQGSDNGSLCRDEDESLSSLDKRKTDENVSVKEMKSILKKRVISPSKKASSMKRSNSYSGKASSPFNIRDSLEVTRLHQKEEKKPRKKSVRFADLDYGEEEEEEISEDDGPDNPIEETMYRPITIKPFPKKSTVVSHKPPRPMSAKVTSTVTPPKDSPASSTRRVVSAGTVRPTPQPRGKTVVRPQAAAHIITRQSSFNNPVTTASGYQISLVSPGNRSLPSQNKTATMQQMPVKATPIAVGNKVSPTTPVNYPGARGAGINERKDVTGYNGGYHPQQSTQATPVYVMNGTGITSNGVHVDPSTMRPENNKYSQPVYNDAGLRLDRTPTDDEINWLWDKVRTCLHRESQGSTRGSDISSEYMATGRQAAPMSSKVFDGNMLAQHANVSRVAATSSSNLRRYNSAESVNSYSKRSALLQQRQQQPPHSIVPRRLMHAGKNGSTQYSSMQSPKQSQREPQATHGNGSHNQELTESMAGFLAAEELSNQSVSESTIHSALEMAQQRQHQLNASKPASKVPTALSIEEQRLMESLDKLNEKLKITENTVDNGYQQTGHFIPRPIAEDMYLEYEDNSGFKGRQPLLSSHKQLSDTGGRFHYRTGSGTATSAQSQYRYH